MAFIKKEWKNRLVEFAGRRKLTRVAGSIDNQIVVDVTREEGTVSQQGDAFSEENMNDLEQRIEDGFNDAIDKDNILNKEEVEANTEAGKHVADALVVKDLNDSLQGFTPVVDETTGEITGYKTKVGADTVFPFKKGFTDNIVMKGCYSNATFDVSSFRSVKVDIKTIHPLVNNYIYIDDVKVYEKLASTNDNEPPVSLSFDLTSKKNISIVATPYTNSLVDGRQITLIFN